MGVYTEEELEGLLSRTLRLFCDSHFVYNKAIDVDATITFDIDEKEKISCSFFNSFSKRKPGRPKKPFSKRLVKSIKAEESTSMLKSDRTTGTDATTELGNRETVSSVRQLRSKTRNLSDISVTVVKQEPTSTEPSPEQEKNEDSVNEAGDSDTELSNELPEQDPNESFHEYRNYTNENITNEDKNVSKETITEEDKDDNIAMTVIHIERMQASSSPGHVSEKPDHLEAHNYSRSSTGEKPYSCADCGKSYRSISGYRAHGKSGCIDRRKRDPVNETENSKKKRPRYMCGECHKVYEKPNRLEIHMRSHTGEKPFSCPKCKKCFQVAQSCRKHTMKCGLEKKKKSDDPSQNEEEGGRVTKRRVCQYCGRRFSKPNRLMAHERTHSGERPFQCAQCGRGYVSLQSLKVHLCENKREKKRREIRPPPQHPCSYCGKIYRKRHRLLSHERQVHTGERPFLCATCGKAFASKVALRQHNITHTERSFKCEVCNAEFLMAYTLKVHMRLHTGERPHVCWHCGRSFRQQSSFQIHMRTHTKEKPLKCKICPQRFAHRSLLVKHQAMHTGEKQYSCSQCQKEFWTKYDLKTHEKTHLGIKNHVCTHCDMRFTQISSLKRHMNGHTGVNRAHNCPICGKSFTRSHQVTIHMKVHMADSPYRCQICGTNFKSMSSRKMHMESLHPEQMEAEIATENIGPILAAENAQEGAGFEQIIIQYQPQQLLEGSQTEIESDNVGFRAPMHVQHTDDGMTFADTTDHFQHDMSQGLDATVFTTNVVN